MNSMEYLKNKSLQKCNKNNTLLTLNSKASVETTYHEKWVYKRRATCWFSVIFESQKAFSFVAENVSVTKLCFE